MGENLKEELMQKIKNEYKEFIENLKKKTPEEIIESSSEKVCKQEMIYVFEKKDFEKTELKALLKNKCILGECYDEWLKSDNNFNEMLKYSVDERVESIVNNYRIELKDKSKDSR